MKVFYENNKGKTYPQRFCLMAGKLDLQSWDRDTGISCWSYTPHPGVDCVSFSSCSASDETSIQTRWDLCRSQRHLWQSWQLLPRSPWVCAWQTYCHHKVARLPWKNVYRCSFSCWVAAYTGLWCTHHLCKFLIHTLVQRTVAKSWRSRHKRWWWL